MVALHNNLLSQKDIFPGVLWTFDQWNQKADQFRAALAAQGVEEPQLSFSVAREMENYVRHQPSYKERQEVLKILWAARAVKHDNRLLTPEQIAWLIEHLDGTNDPVGAAIRERLIG